MVRIWKEFSFSAGHYLTNLPKDHKCSNQHGHTYKFRLYIEGSIDPFLGWITDWGGLVRAAAEMVCREVDHKNLNDVPGLEQPTCEILTKWVFDRVAKTQLAPLSAEEQADIALSIMQGSPLGIRPHLVAVEVFEDLTTGCYYQP